MNYKRDIKEEFLKLFLEGNPLNFFIYEKRWDLQIRANKNRPHGWITLYFGLTKILDIIYKIQSQSIKFNANNTYKKRSQTSLFRDGGFTINELQKVQNEFMKYKEEIDISDSHYNREGKWQQMLSKKFGKNYQKEFPFLVFDREVVISFENQREKDKIENPLRNKFKEIAHQISKNDPDTFGTALSEKSFGGEVDLIGIKENELFLIEVKPCEETIGIYRTPLQVGLYTELWLKLLEINEDGTIENINRMIEQKERLGLIPSKKIRLKKGFKIRPVVIIGGKTSSEVVFHRLKTILEQVNKERENCLKDFRAYEINESCEITEKKL